MVVVVVVPSVEIQLVDSPVDLILSVDSFLEVYRQTLKLELVENLIVIAV